MITQKINHICGYVYMRMEYLHHPYVKNGRFYCCHCNNEVIPIINDNEPCWEHINDNRRK